MEQHGLTPEGPFLIPFSSTLHVPALPCVRSPPNLPVDDDHQSRSISGGQGVRSSSSSRAFERWRRSPSHRLQVEATTRPGGHSQRQTPHRVARDIVTTLPSGPKLLEDERFIWRHVWPRIAGGDGGTPSTGFGLTVHRSERGRRPAVAESSSGKANVVAKLYSDGDEGRSAHHILRTLRQRGFGASSPFRVPEPIAYLPEHGVLLMERAQGEALGGLEMLDRGAFKDGLSQAARWLGALHVSLLRVG